MTRTAVALSGWLLLLSKVVVVLFLAVLDALPSRR
jgi:hypothetical protein